MVNTLKGVLNRVVAFVKAEPVRVATWVAAVIVFAAAKFGLVVSEESVVNALLLVVPVLLGGEVARNFVSPVSSPTPSK